MRRLRGNEVAAMGTTKTGTASLLPPRFSIIVVVGRRARACPFLVFFVHCFLFCPILQLWTQSASVNCFRCRKERSHKPFPLRAPAGVDAGALPMLVDPPLNHGKREVLEHFVF